MSKTCFEPKGDAPTTLPTYLPTDIPSNLCGIENTLQGRKMFGHITLIPAYYHVCVCVV